MFGDTLSNCRRYFFRASAALMLFLSGCAVAPDTIVHTPLTARPSSSPAQAPTNGAIFNVANYRPLFEDRRARMVGDIITINIVEKSTADKTNASSGSKTGKANASIPSITGLPIKALQGIGAEATSGLEYSDKGAENAGNNFSGTITATVIEVLSNGNLVVSGEKQVAMNKGTEFIRFSGVVSPDIITAGNVVTSTQVADARIEYRTNSTLDQAQVLNLVARFFLSVLPF